MLGGGESVMEVSVLRICCIKAPRLLRGLLKLLFR
jgi:hypothetical protein